MNKIAILIAIVAMLYSCTKESATPNGQMVLEFDNIVGDANLQLNTPDFIYTNANGETYKVTRFAYYVSNMSLRQADGTVYKDEMSADGSEGYYLIDEADGISHEVTLKNIPPGEYTEVQFTIGIDASQVDQTTQSGPLDPDKGMFLDWNSGYIAVALEGIAPSSPETNNIFQYYISGYRDDAENDELVNNLKTITLSFHQPVEIEAAHEPKAHILIDVSKILDGNGASVTFTADAIRHSPKSCEDIAGNLPEAFVVDHVHAH